MNLEQAKEILEGIGLLDSITDELVEACETVCEELDKWADDTPKFVPPPFAADTARMMPPPRAAETINSQGYWERYFAEQDEQPLPPPPINPVWSSLQGQVTEQELPQTEDILVDEDLGDSYREWCIRQELARDNG